MAAAHPATLPHLKPEIGALVVLTDGNLAGETALVLERRANGLYRVRITTGLEKGREIYGVLPWQMKIKEAKP